MSIINTSIIHNTIIKNTIIDSSIIGSGDGSNLLRAIQGWTGDANCVVPSETEVTVTFSGDVTYTNHTGVIIIHDNGGVFTITGSPSTPSPAKDIIYEGTWDIALAFGDNVSYAYSGGNYQDDEAVPMEDSNLTIKNCLNIPPELVGVFDPPDGEVGVIYDPYDTSVLFTGVD